VVAPKAAIEIEDPDATRSVRFLKTTVLRKQPRNDADKVGIIRKGEYAGVQAIAAGGGGCRAWIQIAPRGWACQDVLETSPDELIAESSSPTIASLIEHTDAARPLVPGVYGVVYRKDVQAFDSRSDALAGTGRVLAGSNTVRASGVVNVDGKRYWRTTGGDLIDATAIAWISPSKFQGVMLEPTATLPAWVRSRSDQRKPIQMRATASATGKIIGQLAPRTVVTILEQTEDGRFARINETAWVARTDLRAATIAAPPAGTGSNEKWFDIDLDEQVLVAYEGERPVFATLVSTGKYGHSTPTGITRVVSKHKTASMNNDKGDKYSVADVPWTMYYDGNYALHTSYWHDGFGGVRSHGCVNLSPRDASLLYQWSSPDVPQGWITVYGDQDNPGSLVRTHSRKQPEPKFRGYARAMTEQLVSSK